MTETRVATMAVNKPSFRGVKTCSGMAVGDGAYEDQNDIDSIPDILDHIDVELACFVEVYAPYAAIWVHLLLWFVWRVLRLIVVSIWRLV